MRIVTISSFRRGASLALGVIMLGTVFASTATAATVQYDLVGDMHAPLYWYRDTFSLNRWYSAGGYFHMFIEQGDVVLTYDDRDTAGTADDIVSITGTSQGCVGNAAASNCGNDFNKKSSVWGVYQGAGTFEWDILMQNPVAGLTDGPDDFAFDQQQAGSLRLIDGAARVPATIDVMLKRDKDFAFRLFPDEDGDGIFDAEGWLALRGGVLGAAGVRGEHGPNNSRLNWDLHLIRRGDTPEPPEPPGSEVPEPASLLLLSSSLLFLRKRRNN